MSLLSAWQGPAGGGRGNTVPMVGTIPDAAAHGLLCSWAICVILKRAYSKDISLMLPGQIFKGKKQNKRSISAHPHHHGTSSDF